MQSMVGRAAEILQRRSCHLLPHRNSTVNGNHNCCSSFPHISTAVFSFILVNGVILELYINNWQFSQRISDASSTKISNSSASDFKNSL